MAKVEYEEGYRYTVILTASEQEKVEVSAMIWVESKSKVLERVLEVGFDEYDFS